VRVRTAFAAGIRGPCPARCYLAVAGRIEAQVARGSQVHQRSEIVIPKHGAGTPGRRAIGVGRTPQWLAQWVERRRQDRGDTRVTLADHLDAYLDLMSGLEATKQAPAKSLSDPVGGPGPAPERRQVG